MTFQTIKDFGAVGDGRNDTDAIQAALDSQQLVVVPLGCYKISRPLRFKSNSGLLGMGACQYEQGTNQGPPLGVIGQSSVIYWDPTIDPAKQDCLNRYSAMLQVAVNQPSSDPGDLGSFASTLYSVQVRDLVIDGSGKAGIGLYAHRCQNGSVFENIIVRNCVWWGILGIGLYSGKWSNVHAIRNHNHGMQFGGNPWFAQWSSRYRHGTVNAVLFDSLYASANGTAGESLVTEMKNRGASFMSSPHVFGEGISLYLHRGNTVTNFTSEANYGPGVYIANTSGPNTIIGGYVELNCVFPKDATLRDTGFLLEDKPIGTWLEVDPYWKRKHPQHGEDYPKEPQNLLLQGIVFATGDQYIRVSGDLSDMLRATWPIAHQVVTKGVFGTDFLVRKPD